MSNRDKALNDRASWAFQSTRKTEFINNSSLTCKCLYHAWCWYECWLRQRIRYLEAALRKIFNFLSPQRNTVIYILEIQKIVLRRSFAQIDDSH